MPLDLEKIYELLPAVYRLRDARPDKTDGPARGLLRVVAQEVAILEENLSQLYDDEFIETCADWVVPYIGDLLGVRGLHPVSNATQSQRAYVADTIGYRRRKGTASVIEQLARDVTGLHANAVEFFQLLTWNQYMKHIRPGRGGLVDVRGWEPLERLGTPFDSVAHSVDVRRIASRRGRFNIPNVGVFLWRLDAHSRTESVALRAASSDPHRFYCSPLGINVQLVTMPVTEDTVSTLSTPLDVPIPISRRVLKARVAKYIPQSFVIEAAGTIVPADQITACDLRDVLDGSGNLTWAHTPPGHGTVAVDPVLGRIAFPVDWPAEPLRVTYATAFAADMGGGEYGRRATFALDETKQTLVKVPGDYPSIGGALNALGGGGIVEVTDSNTYSETLTINAPNAQIEIRAANESWPVLDLGGNLVIQGAGSDVFLNGFLIQGGAIAVDNAVSSVTLRHCTLVPGLGLQHSGDPLQPGAPSLVVTPLSTSVTTISIKDSICGPLRLPARHASLTIEDSILDGASGDVIADQVPALVSGDLTAFPSLAASPQVDVTVGTDGPHRATLAASPVDINDAAAKLEAAIRAANPSSPAFAGTRVVAAQQRLIVIPAAPGWIGFADAASDTSASQLALIRPSARRVHSLRGGPLAASPTLHSPARTVAVTIGGDGPRPAQLSAAPSSVPQAAVLLQAAVRSAAGGGPSFSGAMAVVLDAGIIVLPGVDGDAVVITATSNDPDTATDLGLSSPIAVVAASAGGEVAGCATVMRGTTAIGSVHVDQMTEASDCIFVDPLTCDRRQTGCVRFSYVPAGSLTPRRYRCQPADSTQTLRPIFTSLQFGSAGYCQLRRSCPVEIWAGASNDAEMGAFNQLFEPQRETNVRVALEEYLRFAMEAGIFYPS
jgi:hypothetical protein